MYGKQLQARAFLRGLLLYKGSFRPLRLMVIYAIMLPLVILSYPPIDQNPQILRMWIISVLTTLSFYKLSPI